MYHSCVCCPLYEIVDLCIMVSVSEWLHTYWRLNKCVLFFPLFKLSFSSHSKCAGNPCSCYLPWWIAPLWLLLALRGHTVNDDQVYSPGLSTAALHLWPWLLQLQLALCYSVRTSFWSCRSSPPPSLHCALSPFYCVLCNFVILITLNALVFSAAPLWLFTMTTQFWWSRDTGQNQWGSICTVLSQLTLELLKDCTVNHQH